MKSAKSQINYNKPSASVVIAARNEEKNIGRLLTALVNQTYSEELFEIIVADDDSTDGTADIVLEFSNKFNFVKLVKIENREQVKSPKKNALAQAIKMAKGEIILSTDADCMVGKHWIKAMISNYSKNDFVAGFSRTKIENWQRATFVQKYEYFDFLAMFGAAAGALNLGKAFSCSGQNISYKKKAFEDVGGFESVKHLISGDDVNLMQLFRKYKKKIGFAFSKHSFAFTKPVENWQQFFSQRSRWASNMKWQILLNPEFFIYLISVFLLTILPLVMLFTSIWTAISIIALRIIFEYKFLQLSFDKFYEDKKRLKFYFIWFLVQPFYMIVVALMGALNIFSWKK